MYILTKSNDWQRITRYTFNKGRQVWIGCYFKVKGQVCVWNGKYFNKI